MAGAGALGIIGAVETFEDERLLSQNEMRG